jgi:hypothetical protein
LNSGPIEAQLNDHKLKQAQKWSSRIRELQTQDLARKRQTTNEKAEKNSTLPLTFSMQALPLR